MIFYLSLGLALWGLCGVRLLSREFSAFALLTAGAVFWGIAALRYHTGYDWPVYEAFFNGVELNDFFVQPVEVVVMEPLYYALNYVVKYFSDEFQILIVVATTFNCVCIWMFTRHSRCSQTFAMAYYFCWIYLPLQMGTVRQSLALSFVMLAMIAWAGRAHWKALFLVLISLGFQVSALLYIPIFFGFMTRFVVKNKLVFLVVVLVFYSIGIGGGELFLDVLQRFNMPLVSEKVGTYQEFSLTKRSFGGCFYLVVNCCILFFSAKYVPIENRFDRMLIGCIALQILFLGVFFDFALLWNRVQYLAVLPQAIMLYRLILCLPVRSRFFAYPATILLSVSILGYQLSGIDALPFVPYYSYIEYLSTGDEGTGRDRSLEYLDHFNSVHR